MEISGDLIQGWYVDLCHVASFCARVAQPQPRSLGSTLAENGEVWCHVWAMGRWCAHVYGI